MKNILKICAIFALSLTINKSVFAISSNDIQVSVSCSAYVNRRIKYSGRMGDHNHHYISWGQNKYTVYNSAGPYYTNSNNFSVCSQLKIDITLFNKSKLTRYINCGGDYSSPSYSVSMGHNHTGTLGAVVDHSSPNAYMSPQFGFTACNSESVYVDIINEMVKSMPVKDLLDIYMPGHGIKSN